MLEPSGGSRRRALARDKFRRISRRGWQGADAAAKDLANRTRGIAAAARGRLSRAPVSDEVLLERVRAKLGRVCSHPRALDVEARDGRVTVRGPIIASEVPGVLAAVAAVRGVQDVSDLLEPHETAEGIPSLQGEGRIAGSSLDLMPRRWAPATRALVGVGLLASGIAAAKMARGGDAGMRV
jgi:hypothetical protein